MSQRSSSPKPAAGVVRERRMLLATELRSETKDDGKQYLTGYAATYNTVSEDLGWGMRERIMPGAFNRALAEKQDVCHLINHDPNLVLGRTESGTTTLSTDAKGLMFRTLLPGTSYSDDLAKSVERGDVNQCSFGFSIHDGGQRWIEEKDPNDPSFTRTMREVLDVDLFDVSTVTYPAYSNTITELSSLRSLPDGMPVEIRERVIAQAREFLKRFDEGETEAATGGVDCGCECTACQDGDCEECSDESCADVNCRCGRCNAGAPGGDRSRIRTKRVDGEDLAAPAFLIVGNAEDTKTWKLPVLFSTDEKHKRHVHNAIARFNQLKGAGEESKATAWTKLVALCKANETVLTEESRSHLSPDQLFDLEGDIEVVVRLRRQRLREIEMAL